MPKMDGIALTRAVSELSPDVPVVVMTGHASVEYAVESMKAGAADFITKPFTVSQVLFIIGRVLETRRLQRLAQERDYFEELAKFDGLTEIGNYRYFQQMLKMEVERQKRFKRPTALMMIDIDDFKRINDTYGHLAGDWILVQVASLLKKNIRGCDFLARYGGEEFVIILPEITEKEAVAVGLRILDSFDRGKLQTPEGVAIGQLTVTIGVASFPKDAREKDDLIDKADQALYQGKRSGKDCLSVYGAQEIIHSTLRADTAT
jgi:diguanylate cyclase (GGDEF)-like protein